MLNKNTPSQAMKSRLLVVILSVLLAAEFVSAVQSDSETVGVTFFYTNDDTGQIAVAAMETLEEELPMAKITYYSATGNSGLLDSALNAYGIDTEPPLVLVGNAWFSLTGTVSEIESTIQQVKTTIFAIDAVGGAPCPLNADGVVRYPRSVCILEAYNGQEGNHTNAPFRTALRENISYLHFTTLDTAYSQNRSDLQDVAARLSKNLTPPLMLIGENVWNLSSTSADKVVADALHYALVGLNCPTAEGDKGDICIVFFYSPTCHTCVEAKQALQDLTMQYSLNITTYTTLSNTGLDLLFKYYNAIDVPNADKGSFALFVGDRHYGKLDDFDDLETYIQQHVDHGLPCPEPAKEGNADERVKEFTILTVIAGGLIDGINPCAFATLVFFIAYLERVRQGKQALLTIGLSFSAAVFAGYFLIGVGIMEFYYGIEEIGVVSEYIYLFAGMFALVLAVFNIGDYLRMGREEKPVLQLPRFLKRRRGRLIRVVTEERGLVMLAILAFATGLGISLLEFVCTGQILFPIMAVIKSASPLRTTAIGYLILYTSMFILPLLVILALFYKGFTSQKLGEMQKKRQGLVKILTAMVLGIVGSYMLYITLT
jgi:hypothetical protein